MAALHPPGEPFAAVQRWMKCEQLWADFAPASIVSHTLPCLKQCAVLPPLQDLLPTALQHAPRTELHSPHFPSSLLEDICNTRTLKLCLFLTNWSHLLPYDPTLTAPITVMSHCRARNDHSLQILKLDYVFYHTYLTIRQVGM